MSEFLNKNAQILGLALARPTRDENTLSSNFIQLNQFYWGLTSPTIRGSIATYYQPNIAKNLGTGCSIAVHVFLSGRCQ